MKDKMQPWNTLAIYNFSGKSSSQKKRKMFQSLITTVDCSLEFGKLTIHKKWRLGPRLDFNVKRLFSTPVHVIYCDCVVVSGLGNISVYSFETTKKKAC